MKLCGSSKCFSASFFLYFDMSFFLPHKANLKVALSGARPCHYRTWIEFALSDSLAWWEGIKAIPLQRQRTAWHTRNKNEAHIQGECSATCDLIFDLLIVSSWKPQFQWALNNNKSKCDSILLCSLVSKPKTNSLWGSEQNCCKIYKNLPQNLTFPTGL